MAQKIQTHTYVIDPHTVWDEVPSAKQSTSDATRPVAALTVFVAYLLSGKPLTGIYADISTEDLHREIQETCTKCNVDIERVFDWAASLLIEPNETFSDADKKAYVPRRIEGKGFELYPYQWDKAAWAGYRLGSILDLSCGTGKTGVAFSAAVTAARTGRCQTSRCHIYAPLNAMGAWDAYVPELGETFSEVKIFSIDSAHHLLGLARGPGGAIILDEAHKLKAENSQRGNNLETIRNAYEWGVGLTGTFLHEGAEGVMRTQDLAVPGLSRYLNKWTFGEHFKCIIQKKIGRRTVSSLGRPGADQQAAFARYLSRGVTSLTMDSPEVRACVTLPGQTFIDADTWEMPPWAREKQIRISKADSRNQIYWAPDFVSDGDTKRYMAAMALAMADLDPDKKLPSFASLLHTVCKEGRVGRVITKEYGANENARFYFDYEPGKIIDPANISTLPWGPKIEFVEQWLNEHPKEPAILASVGTLGLFMLSELLQKHGVKFEIIRGGVTKDERSVIVKDFEDGKFRVCLIQQAAGAESITLLRATTSILIDHHWSSSIYAQFKARNYRIGQKSDVTHYDAIFGTMQRIVVSRLKRGEAFDAAVRAQIEQQYVDKDTET